MYKAGTILKGTSLVTVDLTDPTRPEVLGILPLTGSATQTDHLAVDGSLAMVSYGSSGSDSGFLIVDVSVPASPSPVSETVFSAPGGTYTAAHLAGSVALTSNRNHLLTFDVSPPIPVALDSIEVFPVGEIFDTAVIGDVAFATTGYELLSIDISDPANLVLTDSESGWVESLGAVGGAFLALLNIQNMSWLSDTTVPGSPTYYGTPEAVRGWFPGMIVGDAWIRPSGPFLDVNSLGCHPPEADFSWSGLGQRIRFYDLSRYGITVHQWDFGDGKGTSRFTYSVDHVYDHPGQYTVTLEVTGPGGTDTIARLVEVATRIFADDFETGDTVGWD